jgi:SAM-dependent methyltransferase
MSFYGDHVLPRILNVVMDTRETREIRSRVCARLAGDVVEIGFGTGHNLPYLPPEVKSLCAVEPSRLAVRLAGPRIAASPAAVEVAGLDGQRLPIADGTADSVLCTWSLCTIPDPGAAVAEMRRVLRPGGTLHFAEHGRAPDESVRTWQHRLDGVQQRVAGGCHLGRDIAAIIAGAGMTITLLDTYYVKGGPRPYGAMYEGVAIGD